MDEDTRSVLGLCFKIISVAIAAILFIYSVVLIVNAYVPFLPSEGIISNILGFIRDYGYIALMVAVTLAAAWSTRSVALRIVVLVLCVAVVIFNCLPAVRESIEQLVGIAK